MLARHAPDSRPRRGRLPAKGRQGRRDALHAPDVRRGSHGGDRRRVPLESSRDATSDPWTAQNCGQQNLLVSRIWGRGRQPRAVMEAARVVEIVSQLDTVRVDAWLDGGWGIDALLGRQTRVHDDLDVIVRLEDVRRVQDALGELGYSTVHGAAPSSFEMTDAEGRQVDVHPVRLIASGEALYRMENGEDWVFPPSSLSARGSVSGFDVRCVTPEIAMVNHTMGYALDAVHRADVAALSERFGIPVPEYLSLDSEPAQ